MVMRKSAGSVGPFFHVGDIAQQRIAAWQICDDYGRASFSNVPEDPRDVIWIHKAQVAIDSCSNDLRTKQVSIDLVEVSKSRERHTTKIPRLKTAQRAVFLAIIIS